MIDYFDYVTLRTKESDFLVKQLFNLRSLGWNLGKTPQQIVEHVHCANYEKVQRFFLSCFLWNVEHWNVSHRDQIIANFIYNIIEIANDPKYFHEIQEIQN